MSSIHKRNVDNIELRIREAIEKTGSARSAIIALKRTYRLYRLADWFGTFFIIALLLYLLTGFACMLLSYLGTNLVGLNSPHRVLGEIYEYLLGIVFVSDPSRLRLWQLAERGRIG